MATEYFMSNYQGATKMSVVLKVSRFDVNIFVLSDSVLCIPVRSRR